MKRLIFVATLAIMAVGCQKTDVNNPVENPIGFSAETGKQTRAIVSGNTYPSDASTYQPFGVFSYGYKVAGSPLAEVSGTLSKPMVNVEITKQSSDWKANPSYGSFYWPNDPSTRLDFYAYSPFIKSATIEPTRKDVPHQVMIVSDLTHDRTAGLSFTGYVHSNKYVDFMEATPIKSATFNFQNGTAFPESDIVQLSFNHKMTQIVFKVTTAEAFPNVKFTIKNISLINYKNTASYADGQWDESGTDSFQVFPADSDNGAVLVNPHDTDPTLEKPVELMNTSADANPLKSMKTAGVTMIPQEILKNTQGFTIVYEIEGPGVAKEEVTKTAYFRPNDTAVMNWENNKYITYNVAIGLREIKFKPSVVDWDADHDDDGNVDDDDDVDINI